MYQSLIALFLLILVQLPVKASDPLRLVVLAPDLANNLVMMEASEQIVGIIANPSLQALLPEAAVVGDHQLLNVEQILGLEPDWVIAWEGGNPESQLQRLESLGLNLLRIRTERLTDLPKQWSQFGVLLDHEPQAERLIAQFEQGLAELQKRDAKPVRLFYELWHDPLMSLNDSSWIADIFELCGAENILGASYEAYPQIGEEAVLAGNVELILASSELPEHWREKWRKWPQIPAVAQDQLYTVNADYLHQLTLNTLRGVREVCLAVERARQAY